MKKDDKVIFHNTRLLLEHYRNVVWSLEVSVFQNYRMKQVLIFLHLMSQPESEASIKVETCSGL